jgi:hypothetical protein
VFAIVGAAGSAILFVCIGVLFVMLAAFVLAIGARAYLVIAQGTTAGQDEIKFPDETPADWLPQSLYILGMLALWVVPAGFLARGLAGVFLPDNPPLRTTILVALAVWLLFPVGLLAMQKAGAILGLLQNLPALLAFYVLSGLVLVAEAALIYFGLFTVFWLAVPVAAFLGAAALLIHARLLGRVGWLLTQADQKPSSPPAAKQKKKKEKKEKAIRVEVNDPWAVPDEPEPEEGPEPTPLYGVRELDVPEQEKPVKLPSYVEPPPDPYGMADEPLPEVPSQPPVSELRKAEIEREVALRTREPAAPPAILLVSGVWTFPFYQDTQKPLALLTAWGLGTLVVARILVMVSPF